MTHKNVCREIYFCLLQLWAAVCIFSEGYDYLDSILIISLLQHSAHLIIPYSSKMRLHSLCGCYYMIPSNNYSTKKYLPLIDLVSHTTILSTASRTALSQSFINPSSTTEIQECEYVFPLYDGVSVVGFTCHIGSRIIHGVVKEKAKAREVYKEAIDRGKSAGLLEQGTTSDAFVTSLGNIPPAARLTVEITYVGELKHDAGADGIRFTIPTKISPRYGQAEAEGDIMASGAGGSIAITVDISMTEDSPLREVRSPSHPIAVTLGRTSTASPETSSMCQASATLSLGTSALDKDFVVEIMHHNSEKPRAILETYPGDEGQRALMTTLVPSFPYRLSKPEIIFVADQSGSMAGAKTRTLVASLRVFLKSLPVGIKFNICLFGTSHSLLFQKSAEYNEDTLAKALRFLEGLNGTYGGTETLNAIRKAIESRDIDQNLSIILATDGDIWQQQQCFDYIDESVSSSKNILRIFALGIGTSVSSALIEGAARAGNGFSQSVGEGEKLDSKVIRMLKGALTADSSSCTMEVQYQPEDEMEDEYVVVEWVTDSLRVMTTEEESSKRLHERSITSTKSSEGEEDVSMPDVDDHNLYSHLPAVAAPKLLQTPQDIPPLYPFTRVTVYILISPGATNGIPKAVILRDSFLERPFEIKIPVEVLPQPSKTIHQLAAKRAVKELEEGRGWLRHAADENGTLLKDKYVTDFKHMIVREAVRLGVRYQIAGKFTSFVAVESNTDPNHQAETREMQSRQVSAATSSLGARNPPNTRHNRTSLPARHSTSGQAPRKQLASRSAKLHALSFGISPQAATSPTRGYACKVPKRAIQPKSEGDAQSEDEEETDPLQKLIALQTFDGCWHLEDSLLDIVGVSGQHHGPAGVNATIWATMLAITFLERKMGVEQEAWDMVVEKARGWLGQASAGEIENAEDAKALWKLAEGLIVGKQ